MKKWGLEINHLQEFEPNREFAGRNWNAGENVEMVIRDVRGKFLPFGMICSVFAHELAHNFHMNHTAKHTQLTRDLNQARKDLQSQGYQGDGFWSSGKRLGDAEWVRGESSVSPIELPTNLCGGAWRRRGAAKRRRRQRPGSQRKRATNRGQPSLHTGAQTTANTDKLAGKRRAVELPGSGSRVDGRNHIPTASAKSSAYKLDENSTFRKRANTNSARDARAAAAMRRISALQGESKPATKEGGETKKPMQSLAASNERLTLYEVDEGGEARSGPSQVKDEDGIQNSEAGSETASETDSETEDELTYDSDGDTKGVCGTSTDQPTTERSDDQEERASSSLPRSRPETASQRQERMQQFRRSEGGRSERQSRLEWQELMQDARKQPDEGEKVKQETSTQSEPAAAAPNKPAHSSALVKGETSDDDDIVFVSSSKKGS